MRKIKPFLLIVLFLVACGGSTSLTPTTSATSTPTETFTEAPSATVTLKPSPTFTTTPQLPVSMGTALPPIHQVISSDNAAEIQLLGTYSGYPDGISVVSADRKRAFFAGSEGIEVFDLEEQQLIGRMDVYIRYHRWVSTTGFLSTSNDGEVIGIVSENAVEVLSMDGSVLYSLPNRSISGRDYLFDVMKDGIGISPDGKLAAMVECAAGEFNTCPFQVVRIDTGEIVYNWEHGMKDLHGSMPRFSPDGSLLATWFDNTLWFWSTADWAPVSSFWIGGGEQPGWAFSPDGTQVAVGQDTVKIWNIPDGKFFRELQPDTVKVSQPCYSLDGKWLAGAGYEEAAIWNLTDGALVGETSLPGLDVALMYLNEDKIETVHLPGHDETLWTGEYDYGRKGFMFVDGESGMELAILQGNQGCLLSLSGQVQCQRGDFMLLGSDGIFYQGSDNEPMTEFRKGLDGSGEITASLDWSAYIFEPDGLDVENGFLFYTIWNNPNNSTGTVMDTARRTIVDTWDMRYLLRISYSPDGKYAAFFGHHGGTYKTDLVLFDRVNRLTVYQKTYPMGVGTFGGVAFSPDSQQMALLVGRPIYIELMEVAWPHKTKLLELTFPEEIDPTSLAYSPDGSLLACSLDDGRIILINIGDGSVVHEWVAHRRGTSEISFSLDGSVLASTGDDGYVKLWGIWP